VLQGAFPLEKVPLEYILMSWGVSVPPERHAVSRGKEFFRGVGVEGGKNLGSPQRGKKRHSPSRKGGRVKKGGYVKYIGEQRRFCFKTSRGMLKVRNSEKGIEEGGKGRRHGAKCAG